MNNTTITTSNGLLDISRTPHIALGWQISFLGQERTSKQASIGARRNYLNEYLNWAIYIFFSVLGFLIIFCIPSLSSRLNQYPSRPAYALPHLCTYFT